MMDHKQIIESRVKQVKKACSELERGVRTIAEMRASIPKYEAELERLLAKADVRDDKSMRQIIDARSSRDLARELLESEPPKLEAKIFELLKQVEDLDSSVVAAGCAEKELLIEEATRALAPFAGTAFFDARSGERSNPANLFARKLPLIQSVPSSKLDFAFIHSQHIDLFILQGERPYETGAERAIEIARASLAIAEAWIQRGGKFAAYLK